MYRYIGNKTRILPFILEKAEEIIGNEGVVVDIMSGTGIVASEFRKFGYKVVAADVMTYSYHHLIVGLLMNRPPEFIGIAEIADDATVRYAAVLDYLNSLQPQKGFFYNEFSPEGTPSDNHEPRKYFTAKNAKKIDAIRNQINVWKEGNIITDHEESLLKHNLILAANKVANISGTYGYFLSSFSNAALGDLHLTPAEFAWDDNIEHTVKQGFAEDIASEIYADLCYIDPPYMKRQYAANYHILETLAKGDNPEANGKSGLRNWWDQHPKFCTKTKGLEAFSKVIDDMNCSNFLVSYSEDGLFSLEQLLCCFKNFGEVDYQVIDYNRFRSNSSSLPKKISEYLISIKK